MGTYDGELVLYAQETGSRRWLRSLEMAGRHRTMTDDHLLLAPRAYLFTVHCSLFTTAPRQWKEDRNEAEIRSKYSYWYSTLLRRYTVSPRSQRPSPPITPPM